MKKTKIIATIGPASEDAETLKKMILAGMNVARLNLSHNKHSHHLKLINNIRKAAQGLKHPVPILFDLQGPKIRTGKIADNGIAIKINQKIALVPEKNCEYSNTSFLRIPIQFYDLYKYVKKGKIIYIDDGTIELEIIKVEDKAIICNANNNGVIKSHKGINTPESKIKAPSVSKKDLEDLEFGIKNKVEFIALSYVADANDILVLRKHISKLEKKFGIKSKDYHKTQETGKWSKIGTRIIAKIERPEGVENFDEILKVSDGVMVARGDLGLEVPLEELPLIQKSIINKCLDAGKPVIVATQMLESMITSPYPSRAEISDIANAILDGADSIMLSAETATGKYPLKSINVMNKIAKKIEPTQIIQAKNIVLQENHHYITSASAFACKKLADQIGASAIICATTSGFTARAIAKHKPKQPIIALSPEKVTVKQLNLSWGVYPYYFPEIFSFDKFVKTIKNFILKEKIAEKGDKIILVTNHPLGYLGSTNLIKVEEV